LNDRNLIIINDTANYVKFTDNKTITKYVIEYISSKELHKVTYNQINHIHLYKKILLLAEIVGAEGRCETEYYFNFKATSILQWKIKFPKVVKPTTIAKRVWDTFKQWLKA